MSQTVFIPYNEEPHRKHFFDMTVEYITWINDSVYNRTGSHVVKDVESYVEQVLPQFSSLKPPKGITLILEHKEKPAGMGALKKLEDGVGEIKRMYVRPKFRGKGYGRKMFEALEDNAREFGLTVLRLDTGGLNVPARRLYESAGYVLRDK